MSATFGPKQHALFAPVVPDVDFIAYNKTESLDEALDDNVAALVLELVQGEGGVYVAEHDFVARAETLCREQGILLVIDEVQTGFGRTGRLFACEHYGLTPDILCLGKALTGGTLPMSVAMTTERIYNAFRSDDAQDRTFYDGHTFCGNPITSAVALAAIDIYQSGAIQANIESLMPLLRDGFEEIGEHESVEYQKSLGMIGMCGFTAEAGGADFARLAGHHAMEIGLFIRPLGDVLYLWPPLVTTAEQLEEMLDLFKDAIGLAAKS